LSNAYDLKGKNKTIIALNKINLKIKPGEIFGLLGPNGAGKTTLVSILTTLLQPTSGYATIFGHNISKESWYVKENVGLMFGKEMIYYRLTGYRNLKFFCKIYGIKDYKRKINEIMKFLNLSEWLGQFVSNYSQGMKLKLALARVLLTEPKLLFLDEPMLGLDPNTVKEVIEILKDLNITIFLTSHQMNVVSKLCDRIAFLKEGTILNVDTQENFKKMISDEIKFQIKVSGNKNELVTHLNQLDFVRGINDEDGNIIISIDNENYLPKLLGFLKDYPVIHLNELRPTLEDVFIKLSR